MDVGVVPTTLVGVCPAFWKRQEQNPCGQSWGLRASWHGEGPSKVFTGWWILAWLGSSLGAALFRAIAWEEGAYTGTWLTPELFSDPEESCGRQIALE